LVLFNSFGYLVEFVNEYRSEIDRIPIDQLTTVSQRFHDTYKPSLQELHQDIMMSFSSFKTGTHVLHGLLRQFLQYYQQFLDLVEHYFVKHDRSTFGGTLVDIQHLMLEMRRYKFAFS
jgi:hypothetical protein